MSIIGNSFELNIQASAKIKQYKKNMSLTKINNQTEIKNNIKKSNEEAGKNKQDEINYNFGANFKKSYPLVLSVEELCDNFEQDARRYPRYINSEGKVVIK